MPSAEYRGLYTNNQINKPTDVLMVGLLKCDCHRYPIWEKLYKKVRFKCPKCFLETVWYSTNRLAKNNWNQLIKKNDLDKWLNSIQDK